MANKDLPQVLGILLCERVNVDVVRRDAISCINIYNAMSVNDFPAFLPLVFAFAQVSGARFEFEYQFKIVDRQSQVIAVSPVAKVQPMLNRFLTHKLISAFYQLIFKDEGTYSVQLAIDGSEVGSVPFQVMKAMPETPTKA